jgi:uncharacterized protein with HEPN domain
MSLDDVHLYDMLIAAQKIVRITTGYSLEDFVADDVVQDSVIRQITIIAEAAANLSESFRGDNRIIPWHEIKGMRNRLIHDYKHIDLNEVWKTVRENIPSLIRQIEPLLPPETP